MIRILIVLFLLLGGPVAALDIKLPASARLTVERNTNPDSYAAPVGVYTAGQVALLPLEGAVNRAAWRIDSPGLTPLQVMRPLRIQLEEAGLEIVLDCASVACGGFDFRFAIETLPGPNMYVNIRRFHFVTALRTKENSPVEAVTILASTSATSAYVQIIQAGELSVGKVEVKTVASLPISKQITPEGDLAGTLVGQGHVVLKGLTFETGSSDLAAGPFEALKELTIFLQSQPALRVALVGHTDSIGGLDGNIALSKRRAQSVRKRLIETYGVNGGRMDAQGMGYLAPLATNLDVEGRDRNRRVEVILLGE